MPDKVEYKTVYILLIYKVGTMDFYIPPCVCYWYTEKQVKDWKCVFEEIYSGFECMIFEF